MFEKLKIFIEINKKRPSEVSNDHNEKQLGKWLSQQLNNYNKIQKSMNNENKYKLWTQFLKDYDQYFSQRWFHYLEDLYLKQYK
jgi:hypothetical protein